MSFQIDWNAVTSDPRVMESVRAQVESLLEEHVNTRAPGTPDDGTRVHLLELEPGSVPPEIQLVAAGMADVDTGDAIEEYAVPAEQVAAAHALQQQQLMQQQQHQQQQQSQQQQQRGQLLQVPRTPLGHRHGNVTPHYRSHSASPGLSTPSSRSSSISSVSSLSARSAHCQSCGGRLPSSASASMPSFSLAGRVAYSGDLYATLQVRRQVNPYVPTKGLMGRLSRSHLPAATMHYPLSVELWVRLGELRIEGHVQATYTPAIKPAAAAAAAPASRSSAAPSPAPSPAHSRSMTPGPFPSPPRFASAAASPALPQSSSVGASPSPGFGGASNSPVCNCAHPSTGASLSASGLLARPASAGAGASAASSSAAPVPAAASPATITILLGQSPLQSYKLTSSLDGSKAGRKLASIADKESSAAIAKLVGQKRTFVLPDFNFNELRKKK